MKNVSWHWHWQWHRGTYALRSRSTLHVHTAKWYWVFGNTMKLIQINLKPTSVSLVLTRSYLLLLPDKLIQILASMIKFSQWWQAGAAARFYWLFNQQTVTITSKFRWQPIKTETGGGFFNVLKSRSRSKLTFSVYRFNSQQTGSLTAKPRALFCRGNRICPMLILAFFLVELSRRFENRNCSLCSAASLPFQNSLVGEFLSVLPLSKI